MMPLFSLFFCILVAFFPLSGHEDRAMGGTCAEPVYGAVLACMCYSCSNIVVISIHIHAFKKAGCVHGSIVSPIMFPPIVATDREI